MRTIWRSLLWREWHEHKWKLAALMAIMLSLQLLLLVEDPGLVTPQIIVWVLCGAPGAFFLGLHAASGERSARTLEFVRALAVKVRRVAIAKLAMGAIASVLPIAVAMLLAIAWLLARQAGGASFAYRESFIARGTPLEDLLLSGAAAMVFSLNVFFWTAAIGMNQPTELRAAAAGTAALIGWTAFSFVALFLRVLEWQGELHNHDPFWQYALSMSPVGALTSMGVVIPIWRVVVLQFAMLTAVACWATVRFGRLSPTDNRSPATAPANASSQSLAAPRSRPWRAMAWKQWREAAPLSLTGAGVIVAMTALYAILGWIESSELYWSANDELPTFLNGATVIVGTLVALVVGTVSFAADVQPGLWTFWRSRPIEPGLWFWPKYFAGAAAVLAFLDLPLAALYLVAAAAGWRISFPEGVLACAPLVHLLAYSAAVCAICWVRRAVYAGILAFAGVLGVLMGPMGWDSLQALNAGHVIGELNSAPIVDFADFAAAYLPFASVMLGLSIAAIFLAWRGAKSEQGLAGWEHGPGRLRRAFSK
ncbi:MAG TPA: hypothetical protein VMV10_15120 [Pirellulales bacterium]|nr:hypothetical protein [Pirellulales bacterium]